jgi:hypothetical protein
MVLIRTRGGGRGETQEKEEERFYSQPDDEDEFISKVGGMKGNTHRVPTPSPLPPSP